MKIFQKYKRSRMVAQRATIAHLYFAFSLTMPLESAPAQTPTMLDSIETEEVAIAAEHAGVPVEPNSPASQVSPPGLDMQQILAELAKVQTVLQAISRSSFQNRINRKSRPRSSTS